MRVLELLGLLLVATRPTRSVTLELGHDWSEHLGSGQANAATRIASSTSSDTMSPSQERLMPHDKTKGLDYPVNKHSTVESNLLKGDSLLAFDFSKISRVDQFGDSSSINELDSSPGSKIDASHINIDSQHLSQEGENLDCLIDSNRIPIDSEMLPSTDFLENIVPDNRNAHKFCDSSSRNLADWHPSTSSNRDASRISVDGQQSIESVEGNTGDCRIENMFTSQKQPVDLRENFVINGFPEQTHKMVEFRNVKYLAEFRMLCRHLNWDLDEVKDYGSLCVFLGKETIPEQVEFHKSVAMTEPVMELLLNGKSGRDTVKVGQNNIDFAETRQIAKAPNTMQKLILISNLVMKLVSCRKSLSSLSPKVIQCFKRTCIPVLQCLVKCCGKDVDVFQTRWGLRFQHHCFGEKWCPGRGSNHNICGSQMPKIVRNPEYRNKDSGLLVLNALAAALSTAQTAEEILKLSCEFYEKYHSSGPVDRKLQQYYFRSSKPIWGCFVHHYGQNTNEWIRKWGTKFAHGEFGRRKCQGLKSLQCGSIDPPFDIPARHELRKKSTRYLLPALSKILEEYDQFFIAKKASMRSPHPDLSGFITKCVRPFNYCLHRHCAGSVEEFVRRWGESVHYTRFSKNYCPGEGRKRSEICQYDSPSSQG